MNPTSAASAVIASNGVSGFTVSVIVVMALIIVILALVLIRALWPNSKPGKAVSSVEHDVRAFAADVAKVEPVAQRAVDFLGEEFDKVLTAAELRLMDTSSEDDQIAQAQAQVMKAQAVKAQKLERLDGHVEKLRQYRIQLAAQVYSAGGSVAGGVTGTDNAS